MMGQVEAKMTGNIGVIQPKRVILKYKYSVWLKILLINREARFDDFKWGALKGTWV